MGAAAHLQVFVVLQAMDLALTLVGVRLGASEANPGVVGALHLGWPVFAGLKILLLACVVGLLVLHGGRPWARTMQVLNASFGAIVAWNVGVLLGQHPLLFGFVGAALVAALPYGSLAAMHATRTWVARCAKPAAQTERGTSKREKEGERAWLS